MLSILAGRDPKRQLNQPRAIRQYPSGRAAAARAIQFRDVRNAAAAAASPLGFADNNLGTREQLRVKGPFLPSLPPSEDRSRVRWWLKKGERMEPLHNNNRTKEGGDIAPTRQQCTCTGGGRRQRLLGIQVWE